MIKHHINLEKFLGTFGVQKYGTPFSYIHGGSHHEFNELTTSWMWEEGVPFSVLVLSMLQKYLKITHKFDNVEATREKEIEREGLLLTLFEYFEN